MLGRALCARIELSLSLSCVKVDSLKDRNATMAPSFTYPETTRRTNGFPTSSSSSSSLSASLAAGGGGGGGGLDSTKQVFNFYLDQEGYYTGTLLSTTLLPHGTGRMEYNHANGDGNADVAIYDGEWQYGHWHGYGSLQFQNGDMYIGTFEQDMRHGPQGLYQWKDGRIYEGPFVRDKRHGSHGTFTWPDGSRYQGEFVAGKRHGQGTYVFADGNRYTGQWKEGKYDGYGYVGCLLASFCFLLYVGYRVRFQILQSV